MNIGLIYTAGAPTGFPTLLTIPDPPPNTPPTLTTVYWQQPSPAASVKLTLGPWNVYSSSDGTALPSGTAGPGTEYAAAVTGIG
jgi:hypothetical protein